MATVFQKYLDERGITAGQFAREKKYPRQIVYQWASGERRPGRDNSIRLETDTEGQVPASSWSAKGAALGKAKRRNAHARTIAG